MAMSSNQHVNIADVSRIQATAIQSGQPSHNEISEPFLYFQKSLRQSACHFIFGQSACHFIFSLFFASFVNS